MFLNQSANRHSLAILFSLLGSIAWASDAVVYLPFEETSGSTAIDLSGNGNHGLLENAAVWTAGKFGNAVLFDGNGQYLLIGNSPSIEDARSAITIAAWVFRSSNQPGWRALVSRQVGQTTAETFWLGFGNNQYRWFVNTEGGGYSSADPGGSAAVNQWVHIAGTYDGSIVRLYVNGSQQFSTSHRGKFPVETNPIAVATNLNDSSKTPDELFAGKIDDLKIWSRALSADEVGQLYQPGRTDAAPATPAPAATQPKKIMPLGASETYGYIGAGSPNNDDGGYRLFLWNDIQSAGIPVDFVGSQQTGVSSIDRDHEGHNGWRIDQISGSIGGWLAAYQPDTLLLTIGANDLIQGSGPATALARLGTLLDQIGNARPKARILVASILIPRDNNDYPTYKRPEVIAFNAGIPALVTARAGKGENIAFVDVAGKTAFSTAANSSDFGADGLHPSRSGYEKIAHVWFDALTR